MIWGDFSKDPQSVENQNKKENRKRKKKHFFL